MSKIERRHVVVTLYQGGYEQRLAALVDATMGAERAADLAAQSEEQAGPRRAGQGSDAQRLRTEAMERAAEHDALMAEARASAIEVKVWAIAHTDWAKLAALHPPRTETDDSGAPLHPRDRQLSLNMDTFPADLLLVSLVDDEAAEGAADLDALIEAGRSVLGSLGRISRVQYLRLERAAWDVNSEDDSLGKGFSLVSLLTQARDHESEQHSEQG